MMDEARAMGQYGGAIAAEKNRRLAMGYYIERHEAGLEVSALPVPGRHHTRWLR